MAILRNYNPTVLFPTYKKGGNIDKNKIITKTVALEFDLDWAPGKVKDKVVLAMSTDSTGLYKIGKDVEKYCGIPEADVIRDVKAGKDRPEDAIIYGMTNIMNGGKDIYFWTNGTRLNGVSKQVGMWPAVIEQISHECVHLTRQILTRAFAKKEGINTNNADWITYNYGAGEYVWPAVGDLNDKNKIVQIEEEGFATALGIIVQKITPAFLEMAKSFLE